MNASLKNYILRAFLVFLAFAVTVSVRVDALALNYVKSEEKTSPVKENFKSALASIKTKAQVETAIQEIKKSFASGNNAAVIGSYTHGFSKGASNLLPDTKSSAVSSAETSYQSRAPPVR